MKIKLENKVITAIVLFLFTISLTIGFAIVPTIAPALSIVSQPNAQSYFEQGTQFYQSGQYTAAAQAFQQAAKLYQSQNAPLKRSAALSNLSLAYQKLGSWKEAQQAIAESLQSLETVKGDNRSVLAQALEIQGGLQLSTGQSDRALDSWQQVEKLYTQTADRAGLRRTQLNQAKTLQVKGFYRRALAILEALEPTLKAEPDSVTKAVALRSLGDTLQLTGDLTQADRVLQSSLEIAQRLNLPEQISAAQFSLGNIARSQQDPKRAIGFYTQAATTAPTLLAKLQAKINHFSLLREPKDLSTAMNLFREIETQLPQLNVSYASAYAHINLAQTVITRLRDWKLDPPDKRLVQLLERSTETLLTTATEQSKQLNDEYLHAYALGTLGYLQEIQDKQSLAQRSTEQALLISQALNASESTYRWQWQLGRLLKAQGKIQSAKSSYEGAIDTLRSLRSNLAAINRDVQFDFRDSVEPVYRETVALLLDIQKTNPSDRNLEQARTLIEQLQLAELDDFFREACLNGTQIVLDQLVDKDNPSTAIIYPIILDQQIQVIVKIPKQPLQSYAINQPHTTTETLLKQLRSQLVSSSDEDSTQELSQQVYQWLIQPIDRRLETAKVNTLVFVLDGEFRNLPMAALYDGKQYLIEKYAVVLSTGLQLLQPQPLNPDSTLSAVMAGLTVPPVEFQAQYASLPEINTEFNLIQQTGINTKILLEQDFNHKNLAQTVQSKPSKIVHLATHGTFSSRADETYILASDGPIYVNELDTLLRDREQVSADPIELLILSACQTAAGDSRATLGLAGVAIRAGARSTLASLWQVDDRATALFMGTFYQELVNSKVSKAEALRRAQVALLKQDFQDENPGFVRPRYWAAYVLIGNWL